MYKNSNHNNLNQSVSGQNNQVAGRDIIIHVKDKSEDNSSLDNPHLIACPICDHRIFREADLCPKCHYNFEKDRLKKLEEARLKFNQGISLLLTLAVITFAITLKISRIFSLEWWRGLPLFFLLLFALYVIWSWCWSRVNTWIKLR